MEKDKIAELIERELDCVVVHSIGHTLTIFRNKSLPPAPRFAVAATEGEGEEPARDAQGKKKRKGGRGDSTLPPPPPEFTVIE